MHWRTASLWKRFHLPLTQSHLPLSPFLFLHLSHILSLHSVVLHSSHPMVRLPYMDTETNCPRIFPVQCETANGGLQEKLRELGQLLLSYCVCHWPQAERLGEPISSDCTHSLKMFQTLHATLNISEPAYYSEMRFIRFIVLSEYQTATCIFCDLSKKKEKNRQRCVLLHLPCSCICLRLVWSNKRHEGIESCLLSKGSAWLFVRVAFIWVSCRALQLSVTWLDKNGAIN